MPDKRLIFSEWHAELLRRRNSVDIAGAMEMVRAELASSPYHPNRIDVDDDGILQFFYNEKQVYRHLDGTYHDTPFKG